MTDGMTRDDAPGQTPAVHEEPVAGAPGATVAPALSTSPTSPDVAETQERPTREDVRRFRLATLRARLALLGVAFDPSTDEATLRRMLRAVEGQGGEAARPGLKDVKGAPDTPDTAGATGAADMIDTTNTIGHTADPAPAEESNLPPSAVMRRATARHLRERQRVAAEDTGVSGVTGSPRTPRTDGTGGSRTRGRGRS